jgi:hypothetical protein
MNIKVKKCSYHILYKVKKYRQVEEQPEPDVWKRMLVFIPTRNSSCD